MTRAALMEIIGPTDHSPSEAMLEELEAEIDVLRKEGFYGATEAQLLDTVRVRRVIADWKLRHQLELRVDPFNRS